MDVRVVAATNRDPQAMIEGHTLREDFYYRLSVISMPPAPLRERSGDIALLARHFLSLSAARYGGSMTEITRQAMARLQAYDWPGNKESL